MFDEVLELQKELENIIKNVDDSTNILEVGAKEFVKDLLKLPKPKSKIKSSKYTHLVDSFSYKKSTKYIGELEVGWRIYHGPMVEHGTAISRPQPHLKPTFNKNQRKYYDSMINKVFN